MRLCDVQQNLVTQHSTYVRTLPKVCNNNLPFHPTNRPRIHQSTRPRPPNHSQPYRYQAHRSPRLSVTCSCDVQQNLADSSRPSPKRAPPDGDLVHHLQVIEVAMCNKTWCSFFSSCTGHAGAGRAIIDGIVIVVGVGGLRGLEGMDDGLDGGLEDRRCEHTCLSHCT